MRQVLVLLSCFMLTVTGFVTVAQAETSIAVVDVRKLLEESTAGKGLADALRAKRDALQKEVNASEKKVTEQGQALFKMRKDMKPEEFEAKKKVFDADIVKIREGILKKTSDLEKQRKDAVKILQENIGKVTADLADEKKIQIVVDREQVVIVDQKLDMTAEALTKLNERIKSIPLQ